MQAKNISLLVSERLRRTHSFGTSACLAQRKETCTAFSSVELAGEPESGLGNEFFVMIGRKTTGRWNCAVPVHRLTGLFSDGSVNTARPPR